MTLSIYRKYSADCQLMYYILLNANLLSVVRAECNMKITHYESQVQTCVQGPVLQNFYSRSL
jgi:hypothetical protein